MAVLPPAHADDRGRGEEDQHERRPGDHGQPASPRLRQTGAPPRDGGWCETTDHAFAVRSRARGRLGRCSGARAAAATVLLVHRPKYDDWSFPKGKLDRGEHATAAAVREVEEETGLRVRLGVPLADQRYPIRAGTKRVHYWVGRAVGDGDVSGYEPNAEIDEVGWFPIDKARRRLTYEFDVDTLDEALEQPRKTRTLVVLRHSQARSRKAWRVRRPRAAAARDRPAAGRQAGAGAGGVRRTPAGHLEQHPVRPDPRAVRRGDRPAAAHRRPAQRGGRHPRRRPATLVERAGRATSSERPASAGGLVLCTHRPVLPWVFDAARDRGPRAGRRARWSSCTCARAGSWPRSGTGSAERQRVRAGPRGRSRDRRLTPAWPPPARRPLFTPRSPSAPGPDTGAAYVHVVSPAKTQEIRVNTQRPSAARSCPASPSWRWPCPAAVPATTAASDSGSGCRAPAAASLSGTLNGGGSSAQEAAQGVWRAGFQGDNSGVTVNYDPVGSGTGRENFISKAYSFAGSDSALSTDEGELDAAKERCGGEDPIEVPAYVSPIAVVYNLDGVDEPQPRRPRRSPRSSTTRSPRGTTRPSPRTTRTPTCRTPPSPRCTARTTPAPPRTSPTTSRKAADGAWTYDADSIWPKQGGEAAEGTSGLVAAVKSGDGTIGYADESQAGGLGIAAIKVGEEFNKPSAEGAAAGARQLAAHRGSRPTSTWRSTSTAPSPTRVPTRCCWRPT